MATEAQIWVGYPVKFTWGAVCPKFTDWCFNPYRHQHGMQCDKTCPCRVDHKRWDRTSARSA